MGEEQNRMARIPRNAEYTKEFNRKLVLRLLRSAPLSRAEISRATGLTRAGAGIIADELLSEGVIEEMPTQPQQRGRTPTPLSVRKDAFFALSMVLNRSGCQVGLVNIGGEVVLREEFSLDDFSSAQDVLEECAARLARFRTLADLPADRLPGLGVCAPGPLDREKGIILNPPRFPRWQNVEIARILEKCLDVPVSLSNTADARALYSLGREEAAGSENYLLLHIEDHGVGSGFLSGGRLLSSLGQYTTELGHTSVDLMGPECSCGNRGCLEKYTSIPNLLAHFDNRRKSWREVIDADDREIIEYEAEYLAAGIRNAVNLVNFDTVLFAGDLTYGFDKLAEAVSSRLNGRSLARNGQEIALRPVASTPETELLSAGELIFSRYLTQVFSTVLSV